MQKDFSEKLSELGLSEADLIPLLDKKLEQKNNVNKILEIDHQIEILLQRRDALVLLSRDLSAQESEISGSIFGIKFPEKNPLQVQSKSIIQETIKEPVGLIQKQEDSIVISISSMGEYRPIAGSRDFAENNRHLSSKRLLRAALSTK